MSFRILTNRSWPRASPRQLAAHCITGDVALRAILYSILSFCVPSILYALPTLLLSSSVGHVAMFSPSHTEGFLPLRQTTFLLSSAVRPFNRLYFCRRRYGDEITYLCTCHPRKQETHIIPHFNTHLISCFLCCLVTPLCCSRKPEIDGFDGIEPGWGAPRRIWNSHLRRKRGDKRRTVGRLSEEPRGFEGRRHDYSHWQGSQVLPRPAVQGDIA